MAVVVALAALDAEAGVVAAPLGGEYCRMRAGCHVD